MKQVCWLIKTYITFLVIFLLQKPLFMFLDKGAATMPISGFASSVCNVMWHGLSLDLAMAGYLSILPGVLFLASVWIKQEIARQAVNIYFGIVSLGISICFILNTLLYPYWSFPLDSTPLFYFLTSPTDAFASASIWLIIVGLLGIAFCTFIIWFSLYIRRQRKTRYGYVKMDHHRLRTSICIFILTAFLFLPIRGGITVSTNNTGKAYFCQNPFLNHAAVNPMFSLMESLTHHTDFSAQYRFLDESEAATIFKSMTSASDHNTYPIFRTTGSTQPDILIVILEGFASDLLPSLGGNSVATNLDTIAQQSILFTNFYANSFRTDRGLVAILSGYPAQPTTSIMRFPEKSAHLPSIARSLANNKHYVSTYYYGGDVDFANQRSYLVSQGYQHIVSDVDFPIQDRLSKWGVPDHIVAQKVISDIQKENTKSPSLRIFQTSSSHEPFDVPYHKLKDKRLNAFAYTDSIIGSLIKAYQQLPKWKNSLIVLVPDHVGAYKEHLDNFSPNRYKIPLILTGGIIGRPMKIKLIGSQQDIAATLLGQLGIAHEEFLFSKNILSDATPKFAFFTVPDAFGFITEENALIYDNQAQKIVYHKGEKKENSKKKGMAYLQKLYDDLNKK